MGNTLNGHGGSISCATISRNSEPSNCQENIRFRLALPEMRRRESGRRTIMFGQKTIPDPHQEIVDQYLREHNPCEPSKPLRINLRKYLQYAEEHHTSAFLLRTVSSRRLLTHHSNISRRLPTVRTAPDIPEQRTVR